MQTDRPYTTSAQNSVAEQEQRAAYSGIASLGSGAVGGLGGSVRQVENYGGIPIQPIAGPIVVPNVSGFRALGGYPHITQLTGAALTALINVHLPTTPSLNTPLQRHFVESTQYPAVASWLPAIQEEIAGLGERGASDDGTQILPTEQTRRDARDLITRCAALLTIEPVVDFDERGNIELFFRNGTIGTLFVVSQDRQLQIIGNKGGEKWSARYQLSGHLWQDHLSTMVRPIAHG